MIKTNKNEIVQFALSKINEKADSLEPAYPHWISGNGCDQSESYCYKCAKAKCDELNKDKSKQEEDYVVDGGWGHQESDIPEHCAKCDDILNSDLTSEGCKEELDHFLYKNSKINISTKEECYELQNVLECYDHYPEHNERIFKLAEKLLNSKQFWIRVKEPEKHEYCNKCGRHHHIWKLEIYCNITHLKKEMNLPDDQCKFIHTYYICAWCKGADKRFIKNLLASFISRFTLLVNPCTKECPPTFVAKLLAVTYGLWNNLQYIFALNPDLKPNIAITC